MTKFWTAERVKVESLAVGDKIRWRGVTQEITGIETGEGMPWPAGRKWRSLKLAPPAGSLVYGFAPVVVLGEGSRIVKVVSVVRRLKGHANTSQM